MSSASAPGPGPSGVCPFCGLAYAGSPSECPRCRTLLGDAAEAVKREGARARRRLHSQRALSDLLFLVGLLLGGPMMTLGGELRLGLFILLAGGLASVLRRYTEWSTPGAVVVGMAAATLAAVSVSEPAEVAEATRADAEARGAYAEALAAQDPDVFVEGRGSDLVAIWFTIPADLSEECGDYPSAEVRTHLADLGFSRVVVTERNQSGGLCSFAP